MPTIELTENLRSTIRTLRKSKKKRGDELSKELGKGASYISQVENGKIKEMDFSLLNKIFRKITDLSDDEYIKFIDDLIDDNALHMSKDELKHEQWIHQFDYEIRKFPMDSSI
ncbi:XRE family transcriptional regulator [Blautia obeum]|uniref:XRE family transcriptional regulator n=1 Tax=Blautia obeum TaxID=40520 RepID=A0A414K412_9FIRM|nr:XRE family transcriptional regulator [Blautia obeum]